jgi:peptidoglycan/LPS O-acetylase OafA/YrhL
MGSAASKPQPAPGVFRHETAIDGLRGVAILAVMLFHFTMYEHSARPLYRSALTVAGAGWAGVDVFFALSGFLITGILLDTKGRPCFFRTFYLRRALRIFPLYYTVVAGVMLVLGLTLATRDPEVRDLFGRQLWLWTYSINIEGALSGRWDFNAGGLFLNHFWSLAIEEQFYLVWPVVVLALSRRALALTAVTMAGTSLVLRAVLTAYGVAPTTVYSFTPCRVDALALGGLAALLVRERVRRRVQLALVAAIAAAAHLAWLAYRERGLPWLNPRVDVGGLTSLAVVASALLVGLSVRPEARVFRPLRSRALVFLGKYSYATYVFHYLLWPRLERHVPAPRLAAASGSELVGLAGHVAIGIAVSVAVAVVSFHVLERPFLGLRRHLAYASTAPT